MWPYDFEWSFVRFWTQQFWTAEPNIMRRNWASLTVFNIFSSLLYKHKLYWNYGWYGHMISFFFARWESARCGISIEKRWWEWYVGNKSIDTTPHPIVPFVATEQQRRRFNTRVEGVKANIYFGDRPQNIQWWKKDHMAFPIRIELNSPSNQDH